MVKIFKNPLRLLLDKKKQKWVKNAVAEIEERGFANFKKPLSMADREFLNKAVKEREDYVGLFEMIPYPDIADDDECQGENHEIQLQ